MSAVEEIGVTSTFWGFVKSVFESLIISFGIVAEKNIDCLFLGSFAIIFFTSWINHISSILSASSSVKIAKLSSLIIHWFIKSNNLQGVAVKISIQEFNILTWECCLIHQKITPFFNQSHFQ